MSPGGVNLVGYLGAVLGLGESARRCGEGLDAAGLPWAGFDLPLPIARAGTRAVPRFGSEPLPHDVTVLWCNPDRYEVDLSVDAALTDGRYTIGRWAWEVDPAPESWGPAGSLLDEIWVSSQFVADTLRGVVEVPVTVLPLPIAVTPAERPRDRTPFGIAGDPFVFLFTFDHHSVTARKNPMAVVDAYRRAFPPAAGAALLVKSVNAAFRPDEAEALHRAAAGRDDIRVFDAALPGEEKDALIAACDCYVSLHRSEGFGIALAEAMALGRPVIGTGYGGNLEFMSGPDALLVRHTRVPVGPGAEPYPADATWAEPDIDHAAALMRALAADPEAAAARGRRGAAWLAARFAPSIAGAVAARHIERAGATLAAGAVAG